MKEESIQGISGHMWYVGENHLHLKIRLYYQLARWSTDHMKPGPNIYKSLKRSQETRDQNPLL